MTPQGIYGWLGQTPDTQAALSAMSRTYAPQSEAAGPGWALAARHPLQSYAIHRDADGIAAIYGRPRLPAGAGDAARWLLAGFRAKGADILQDIGGTFSVAILEPARQRALLAIDRMGVERLCFGPTGDGIAFGADLQSVARHPQLTADIDPQALYDYFYFRAVPAPRTIYRGLEKLLPGQYLLWENGRMRRDFYWALDYASERGRDFASYRTEFRALLDQAVERALGSDDAGAFLSGGTDSSTVVGTMSRRRARPVDTFSIGFAAEGFDEMHYARIAAARFHSQAHEYYLQPQDIVEALPLLAQDYDEPFANESAVPSLFCARLGKSAGHDVMLAGDGGDEIFGGNARYAKQKIFQAYGCLPGWLRRALIEPAARLPGISNCFPLRKLKSYVEQAKVPLPDRMESYNFLHKSGAAQIFTPEFLAQVDERAPLAALREVYQRTRSDHAVDRIMHLDLKFTLADNDLRKVGAMTEIAGVAVRYPLLDDDLVAFSGRLPPQYKVKGLKLRWFFKKALDDVLPQEIIRKSKHGFGLPFGLWALQHAPLHDMVVQSLSALGERGWIKPAYLNELRQQHAEVHPTYYGSVVWTLVMLEQWLAAHL